MRKVGTHGEMEERRAVDVGGGGLGSVEWEKTPARYVTARDCSVGD